MSAEREWMIGGVGLDDEEDADGQGWSPEPYYDAMGLSDEETQARDKSPDDFDE